MRRFTLAPPTLLQALCVSTSLLALSAHTSWAQDTAQQSAPQTQQDQQDTFLSSETLTYDENTGIVIAEGAVEISQGQSVLRADRVEYNENTGEVVADGNVILNDPSGNVLFAENMALTENLSEGFIQSLRLLMADNSRAAALSAVRTNGNRTEMERAVYSPCEVCEENPTPLWQLKAVKVVHDEVEKEIVYRDARLEFLGIPVLYTPYFSHPDPSVKRKSGFLTPRAGQSDRYGFWSQTPYYWAISDHQDATITPYLTQDDGPILMAEYRQKFERGDLLIDGSAAYQEKSASLGGTSDEVFRGHLNLEAEYRPDDIWTLGIDSTTTSDDTFLRRFEILNDDRLESRAYIEGFSGRNSATLNSYYWQGLLEDDDPGETPIALPLVTYDYYTPTSRLGSRWHFSADAAALTADEFANSYRMTAEAQWRLPYTTPIGEVYTLEAAVRGDAYYVDNKPGSNATELEDGFDGRFRPYLSFDYRYPLDRGYGTVRHLIEPFANIFVSPGGGNPDKIPNIDSTTFEFDDTNLTSDNRYPGFDVVGGGTRASYGLKTGIYGIKGGYSEIMVGQSIRLTDSLEYPEGSGAEEKSSDYVGRLTINPHEYLNLETRFRLDGENLEIQRNESSLSTGPRWLKFNFSYASIEENSSISNSEEREQLTSSARLQITENWHTRVANAHDLTDNGGDLYWEWDIGYVDECFEFVLEGRRTYQQDRDVQPSTSVGFVIRLKTLG